MLNNTNLSVEDYIKKVLHECHITRTELDVEYFSYATARMFNVSPERVLQIIGEYDFKWVLPLKSRGS